MGRLTSRSEDLEKPKEHEVKFKILATIKKEVTDMNCMCMQQPRNWDELCEDQKSTAKLLVGESSDLDEGVECTLSKFADNTELGQVADTPGCCAGIQQDLERLESWAEESHEVQQRVLNMGKYKLGADLLESSSAEKDVGVLVSRSQKHLPVIILRDKWTIGLTFQGQFHIPESKFYMALSRVITDLKQQQIQP
ncbi:hypothetical protein WISP_146108 [Willisornis vidua]|uniref:Uncharacterized protein n=1 Tax=Willisornis vidua TaxID=1566151 RepID=A0ABQ9CQZ0_9PASS|nr:hypothetical protein WISP_146108 [Willisornis vidua]